MSGADVVVIGGGQAALAAGYFLRRSGLSFELLDDEPAPGGAWQHTWPSLRLFSPARWSSLPGWLMPPTAGTYPTRDEALAYLAAYEQRYELPVRRPMRVHSVTGDAAALHVHVDDGQTIAARAVISATGTWSHPWRPRFDGQEDFAGRMVHSADYRGPEDLRGQRVLVVGGGNSGAQIFADLVDHSEVQWVTQQPPVFLPDDVDGQVLFDQATVRFQAIKEGRAPPPPRSLGDIVMVESVRTLRARGLLAARPLFTRLTRDGVVWPDGSAGHVDTIVLATGFRPALGHLAPLAVPDERGRLAMDGLRAAADPRLFPLGYGDWTGFASATLVGAGRAARAVVDAVTQALR